MSVRQGTRRTGTIFTVDHTLSHVMSVFPEEGDPGTTFSFALAGYAPYETLRPRLYRIIGDCNSFVAAMPPITLDQSGEGVYRVPTRRDDPPGKYNFVVNGTRSIDGIFTIAGDGVSSRST